MDTWTNYTPQQAADLKLDLSARLDISAPLNEMGERCPWPWGPQQLNGATLGQYHCPYCGAMVIAGLQHLDYADDAMNGANAGIQPPPIGGRP